MYEIRLAPRSLQNIWLLTEAEPSKNMGFITTATFTAKSKTPAVQRKRQNTIHLVLATDLQDAPFNSGAIKIPCLGP